MAKARHLLLALLTVLILAQPFKFVRPVCGVDDYDEDDEPLAVGPDGEEPEDEGADLDYEGSEGISDQDASYDDEEEEDFSAAVSTENDGDVVTLTDLNFKTTLASTEKMMVEFYAPWCGHCQSLAPEYRAAAEILKADNVTLAKVDATRETKLAEHYEVEGFPTIFFFVNGNPRQYNGGRTSDEIVSWVRKKLGPSVETLTTREEAEKVLIERRVISIAYFDKLEGSEHSTYEVAAADDDIYFAQTTSSEIAEMFGLEESTPRPAVALIKDEEEKFSLFKGDFVGEELSKFFATNKLPLVVTFTEETSSKIFGSDIKKQILLFVTDDKYEELVQPFQEAAKEIREVIFVHINASDTESTSSILEYFDAKADEPSIVGFESEDDGRKYKMDGPISTETVKAFARSFADGKATPFLKSDPPPEKNDGPVKVVVGTTFDEIVLDETKDVMLEVYAPWCGHCKKLAPIYEKLGKRFSSVDSVVIAKMDGTTNEHLRVKVEGFPALLFWPAGDKSTMEPLKVEGERTLKPLTKFIKTHAKIPFTLPKKGQLVSGSAEELAESIELKAQEAEAEAPDTAPGKDEL